MSKLPANPARGTSAGDAFHSDCPARMVLDHIGSRWGVLIVTALRDGPSRFSALAAKIEGISEKMLSQTLRTLARDGLVYRQVEPSVPPRVSYGLTPLGTGLADHMQQLFDWLRGNAEHVVDHQRHYDAAAREAG
jgi:DNA-binding HxlR family transcriptional regulator